MSSMSSTLLCHWQHLTIFFFSSPLFLNVLKELYGFPTIKFVHRLPNTVELEEHFVHFGAHSTITPRQRHVAVKVTQASPLHPLFCWAKCSLGGISMAWGLLVPYASSVCQNHQFL